MVWTRGSSSNCDCILNHEEEWEMAIEKRAMSHLIHEAKHFVLGKKSWQTIKEEFVVLERKSSEKRSPSEEIRYATLLNLLSIEEIRKISPSINEKFSISLHQHRIGRRGMSSNAEMSLEAEQENAYQQSIPYVAPAPYSIVGNTVSAISTAFGIKLSNDKRPSSKRSRTGQVPKVSFCEERNTVREYEKYWKKTDFQCYTNYPRDWYELEEDFERRRNASNKSILSRVRLVNRDYHNN